jgi:iron complex transport system substrate-binding protein
MEIIVKKLMLWILAGICLFSFSCSNEKRESVRNGNVIIDVMGREVEIPKEPKRIVIGDHFLETFAVGGEDVFDHVVGWSATVWVKWRNSIYNEFAQAVPRLKEIKDVGLIFDNTFDIELFLYLKPDLLILPVYHYEVLEDGIKEAIEEAQIPIVLIDFSTGTQELHTKSIEVLGQIFNTPDRAKKINNIYNKYLQIIETRISNINKEFPTVYLEKASKGPAIFDETWGNSNWAPVITRAGGINISEKIIHGVGYADNEFILTEDPDYIFFTGSTWPSKDSAIQLGFTVTEEKTRQTAMRYINEREGWSQLTAVQNKHIYMMHHGFIRSIVDFIPLIFMSEKLYPEVFEDFDAEEIAKEFYKEFLPIDLTGSWLCSLYE